MNESSIMNNVNENNIESSHSNLNGKIDLSSSKSSITTNDKPEPVQENSTPKKGTNSSSANNTSSRPKKRKKYPRDATAPKQPLTGYFRFLNDRRETVRNENPTMPFSEITKQLATEWNMLPIDKKQHYLDAAEQDKERYNREFNDYKQTEAYRLYIEKQAADKQNELKKERNGTDTTTTTTNTTTTNTITTTNNNNNNNNNNNISNTNITSTGTTLENERNEKNDDSGTVDIPIFTEEFLDHNKACEAELRQLRKATADYESQNAVLQRHVDSLHAAVNRLETETNHQQTTNQTLQRYLAALRSNLTSCFSSIPLADTYEGATLQNIDSYIERLEYLVNSNMEPSLRTALRSAVSRLDFIK